MSTLLEVGPRLRAAEIARAIDRRATGHGRAWMALCPAHDDRNPSLSIRDGDDDVLLTCHAGCDRQDVIEALRRRGLWPARTERPAIRHSRRQSLPSASEPRAKREATERFPGLQSWGTRLWAACRPIVADTVAATYLEHRGCALPSDDSDLRWHPKLDDKVSGYTGPALVALVTRIETCEPLNLQRTWLAPDGGGKADIAKPRRLLKGHPAYGVIRLWPDDEVTSGLVLGEGIETCLAAARAGLAPVWSTMSAGNLGSFPALPELEGLTVLVDHDRPDQRGRRAGIQAASAVIERYIAAGFDPVHDLRVILPDGEGLDVADLVTGAA